MENKAGVGPRPGQTPQKTTNPSAMNLVFSTFPTEAKAREVAHILVTERLAACANILPPMRSIFRWEGKISDEPEVLVILKCARSGFENLQRRLRALHPYELPEIVALDAGAVLPEYLAWVRQNSGGTEAEKA